MVSWDESGYDLNDPKHPTYHERMSGWGDWARKRARENAAPVGDTDSGANGTGDGASGVGDEPDTGAAA